MSNFCSRILLFLLGISSSVIADSDFIEIVTNFTVNVTKVRDVIIFGCNKYDLLETTKTLWQYQLFLNPILIPESLSNYTLNLSEILTRHNHARTSVIVDCRCRGSIELLERSSDMLYFNKTYQWLLWDATNIGTDILLPTKLKYPGLNTQITYTNQSGFHYTLWDLHSKGRHLGSPLELNTFATYNLTDGFTILKDIKTVQGIKFRDRFNGLKLRGATVIDQDNVTTSEQIEKILSRRRKDACISPFVKYHFDLLNLLRHRLNFTVNYRNSRGWAGRLGNTRFRLGFLGIVQRNEADIGASGAFNRLNRFAEYDIIHQSWKFETGFLYRFTPDLDKHGKSGNFLAPFDGSVWIFAMVSLCVMNCVWRLTEWINEMCRVNKQRQEQPSQTNNVAHSETEIAVEANKQQYVSIDSRETSWSGLSLKTFAAMCQQGMDPIPEGLPSRTIVLTVFLYSLVMYNYYTSSVVGGLLSSTAQGPTTVDDVVSSPLKVSFEDIGYYKVLFRERQNTSLIIKRLYNNKVLPDRSTNDLPVYTRVEDAIPYLKKGGYAFHCEFLDAYPHIAQLFDAGEICDLRLVTGLLETEILNWDITKQSQYSEIFRIVMCYSREAGLVDRILHLHRPKKPPCQALYRVFPIAMSGVSSAFMLLAAGGISALLVMFIEIKFYKMKNRSSMQN